MEDRYFQRWREMYEKSMEVREMDRMVSYSKYSLTNNTAMSLHDSSLALFSIFSYIFFLLYLLHFM